MVEMKEISKCFGATQALYPTTLKVQEGSFTAILGPSGSGKTTLLRICAGLERSDTGELRLSGQLFDRPSDRFFISPEKRGMGMVFQDFALWPHMTVYQNVAFSLQTRTPRPEIREEKKRVLETLDKVGLTGKEKRLSHELSGGEQQRVAFARAIVSRPGIILFDEPLSALDALLREQMRLEIKHMVHQLGLTALYVTHDQTEALSMADQLVIMNQGRIIRAGTPEEVYMDPRDGFAATFLGRSNVGGGGSFMVRPEHIRLSPPTSGDYLELKGTVIACGYLGDRYEISFSPDPTEHHVSEVPWIFYSPHGYKAQEKIVLYVEKHHRYEFAKA